MKKTKMSNYDMPPKISHALAMFVEHSIIGIIIIFKNGPVTR